MTPEEAKKLAIRVEQALNPGHSTMAEQNKQDRESIAKRYDELKNTLGFAESSAQARTEFVYRVLLEYAKREKDANPA